MSDADNKSVNVLVSICLFLVFRECNNALKCVFSVFAHCWGVVHVYIKVH